MMKKCFALLLAMLLAISCAAPAFAAGDMTWSKNTTITSKFNTYNNATVAAGVTVSFKEVSGEPNGITILKSLTVQKGGKLTGAGLLMFDPGATVSGLDLYYRAAGTEYPLPVSLRELTSMMGIRDYRPEFRFSKATGHWVLSGDFQNDPFPQPDHAPQPNDSHQRLADELRTLGLFRGVGTNPDGTVNYDLARPATRVEAVVMLIRLLGKDAEAVNGTWDCPFDDVPSWAKNYIGYAYAKGLTNGTGNGKFGTGDATGEQFVTFVLRALGFSDAEGDFSWSAPQTLADSCGVMPHRGSLQNFRRSDAVEVCAAAVCTATKQGNPLYKVLIAQGAFTAEQYAKVDLHWH